MANLPFASIFPFITTTSGVLEVISSGVELFSSTSEDDASFSITPSDGGVVGLLLVKTLALGFKPALLGVT